ncbi:hypothetical protein BDN72DRAFT_850492 [Pluteus cervinus]|uniref:Uncharacterized protein n=1 Tax=Pluteus cervinus TaxID=181527 RepID=A0ACD3A4G5_9AGAR|nr:hypothetical protein BDN72DRAFT_850492 [Pluteus cervinus]
MDYSSYPDLPFYEPGAAFTPGDGLFSSLDLPPRDDYPYHDSLPEGAGSALLQSHDGYQLSSNYAFSQSNFNTMQDHSPANSTFEIDESPVYQNSPLGSTGSYSPWDPANSGLIPEFDRLAVFGQPPLTPSQDSQFLQSQYLSQFPQPIPPSPSVQLSPLPLSPQRLLLPSIEPLSGQVSHDVPFDHSAPRPGHPPPQEPFVISIQGPQDYEAQPLATPPPKQTRKRRYGSSGQGAMPLLDTSPSALSPASFNSLASPATTADMSPYYSTSPSFPSTPSTGPDTLPVIDLPESDPAGPPQKKQRMFVGSKKHHEATETRRTKEPKLECDRCGLKITSHSNLKIHKLAHDGIKIYPCHSCGKLFSTPRSAGRHTESGACDRQAQRKAEKAQKKAKHTRLAPSPGGSNHGVGGGGGGGGPSGQGAVFAS